MEVNDNIRKEHDLVRNNVAFYDFTLETLKVSGNDAREFLDYIFVNDVNSLQPGQALYSSMLDEDGMMLDDLIMFNRENDTFWITTGMIDQLTDWLDQHVEDRNVQWEDITSEKAIYSIQGPKSQEVMNTLLEDSIDDLGTYEFKDTKTKDGIEVMAARTGFTGELGYELHFHPDNMENLGKEIIKAGESQGIEEITAEEVTLGSLPMEKGFIQAPDFLEANPCEVGLGWTVRGDAEYIGQERTENYKNDGPDRNLLGFSVDEDSISIQEGDTVESEGEVIGKVTAFTYGYSLDKYIGYVMVDRKVTVGDTVIIKNNNGEVEVTLEKKEFS